MFIDETVIEVIAGDGGNGCYSYHREKFYPRGKPDGGNGGRGGSIFIIASGNAHTLQDVSYRRSYKADRGQHGKGSRKYGRSGDDLKLIVPIGTIIRDVDTDKIICDCISTDKQFCIAKGGRGGRGNGALANRKNPTPEQSESGKLGQKRKLRMVLKVLADVGLVGRPNAGKSTFLSTISRAHPKIADYPFTTTRPNLGIVKRDEKYDSYVVADIPGLIEGSHQGKGLGIRFLKHIERTRILAFMVEATSEDPIADATTLMNELKQYSPILAKKPFCKILTKTDLLPKDKLPNLDGWYYLSSVTKDGVTDIIDIFKMLIDKADIDDSNVEN